MAENVEAGGLRGQGMCTAGAFYFINESDVVICSEDATFFDSHVSAAWFARWSRSA